MNNVVLANTWRFFGLLLAQVLIFKQVSDAIGPWFSLFVYPLFVLFLPVLIPSSAAVLLAFLMGIIIDFYYQSPGVHASASAFSAFCRSLILAFLEPKGGFSGTAPIPTPHHVGWQTFIQILTVYLFVHLFWYFAVSEFTFVYFGSILLKTLASLLISVMMAVIYMGLFRTKI